MARAAGLSVPALIIVLTALLTFAASAQPTRPAVPSPAVESNAQPVQAEPSLSDASAFLLGSGLALLIALLAWGEQIRAITRDTRDLERDFLQITGLSRSQLSALLQAKNEDDRLLALTSLMASGKLTTASQVEILPLFERWRALGTKLRSLQSKKYWLTILLTVVFFVTGSAAAYLSSQTTLTSVLIVSLPGALIVALLVIVVSAGRVEQRLNELLIQIAEKV